MDQVTSPIISAAQAKQVLDRPNVVLVDARGGPDAADRFRTAHIAGATFIDLESDLSEKTPDPAKGGRHPLPDPARFGLLLGRMGVSPETHVLAYDDKSGANAAARFWWMLKAAGHDKAQVVDGGLAMMIAAGLPVSAGAPDHPQRQTHYPLNRWTLPLADIDEVDAARQDDRYRVIDVRERFRYAGEREPIDLVAGHIPGAINLPYLMNLNEDGTFRSTEALASLFRKATDSRQGDNVIVHCGSGVTACHTLLAMAAAGLQIPKLYVGSWSEWSRNPRPIAASNEP
jgi:thiosulfate/3-mercaptopyruvate sulfurtransferase